MRVHSPIFQIQVKGNFENAFHLNKFIVLTRSSVNVNFIALVRLLTFLISRLSHGIRFQLTLVVLACSMAASLRMPKSDKRCW